MRMLRWMCGITKLDKIRNERIRGLAKLVFFLQKSKNNLEVGGWVQVPFEFKKIGKLSKNKVLHL